LSSRIRLATIVIITVCTVIPASIVIPAQAGTQDA
jgi:hypothetical protein